MIKAVVYYDGRLDNVDKTVVMKHFNIAPLLPQISYIDATDGYSKNKEDSEVIRNYNGPIKWIIVTNSLDVWSNPDIWWEDCDNFYGAEHNNAYIYNNGKITNIQDLTDKDIRMAHRIDKLYRAGHFDED